MDWKGLLQFATAWIVAGLAFLFWRGRGSPTDVLDFAGASLTGFVTVVIVKYVVYRRRRMGAKGLRPATGALLGLVLGVAAGMLLFGMTLWPVAASAFLLAILFGLLCVIFTDNGEKVLRRGT
jgi:hypothetical protein